MRKIPASGTLQQSQLVPTARTNSITLTTYITKFLEPLDNTDAKQSSINMTISKIPYLKNEILKGSGRSFHKHFRTFLNDLQWLHMRTLHTSQGKLKQMVKDEACIGFGVTYGSIKDLELGS